MKNIITAMLAMTSICSLYASEGTIPERPIVQIPEGSIRPANPMENYTPSTMSENQMYRIWNSMNRNVDGKDCYRRAHIWAYDMYDYYRVKSMKVFIHYTNKFNRELDYTSKMSKRGIKGQIDYRIYGLLDYNKPWDYHVAPLIQLDSGEYRVMDKTLAMPYDARFPYTDDEAWRLSTRPSTIEEWLEGLNIRGELLWKARKAMLERDMARASGRNLDRLRAKYEELGMDKNDEIDIKCHKAESIADVDLNHANAYCFYTIAPMYYYNEIDLRYLAFGNTRQKYSMPVRLNSYTEENFEDGRNYVVRDWNYFELKDAKKELGWGDNTDYSRRIQKERY